MSDVKIKAEGKGAGALETAVALFDELYRLARTTDLRDPSAEVRAHLVILERRRTDLEPRLAKLRENQGKVRG